ncbi:hypothetical protein [Rhodovarius lipocyclicus]|uniref:hypothetical protein n=1 Tax=Rhodovarius lipocyclicus TaxID=268410 RepID=UPI001357E4A5|nr:hypothetical protein [Rhodovarius lipocyclicus]
MAMAMLAGMGHAVATGGDAIAERPRVQQVQGGETDALLLELAREFASLALEEERLQEPHFSQKHVEYTRQVDVRLGAIAARQGAIMRLMATHPATSLLGIRAKAQVLALWLEPEMRCPAGTHPDDGDPERSLAWTLCCELGSA